MAELIDVPTCDYGGSSSWPEPSPMGSINTGPEDVDRSDTETLPINPNIHATIYHRVACRLCGRGLRISTRLLTWLDRALIGVDGHHWQAHLH